MSTEPLFSIVTPCLNRAAFIGQAVTSVMEQGVANFEHIIVDGGSTDGTLEILNRFPHLTVISEKDENLYQALNKGILASKGKIIGHLNSDDRYPPGALQAVAEAFERQHDLDTVYGYCDIYHHVSATERQLYKRYTETGLSLPSITLGVSSTNARFFSRAAYKRIGLYDESYRIAGDREFLLRAFQQNLKSVKLDQPLYDYGSHAGSLTIASNGGMKVSTAKEYVAIAEAHLAKTDIATTHKAMKNWIENTCCLSIIQALKAWEPQTMAFFLSTGIKHNLAFPLNFVRHILVNKTKVWLDKNAR